MRPCVCARMHAFNVCMYNTSMHDYECSLLRHLPPLPSQAPLACQWGRQWHCKGVATELRAHSAQDRRVGPAQLHCLRGTLCSNTVAHPPTYVGHTHFTSDTTTIQQYNFLYTCQFTCTEIIIMLIRCELQRKMDKNTYTVEHRASEIIWDYNYYTCIIIITCEACNVIKTKRRFEVYKN